MHQFKDCHNPPRLWTLTLTIAVVKRVRQLVNVDLLDVSASDSKDEPPLIIRLIGDPVQLCDVLYALCKPEADKLQVTDEAFGEAMGGEALLDGQQALLGELIDFFHQSGRTELEQVTRQAQRVVQAAVKAATEKLETIDVEKLTNAAVGNLFTAAQASLDKILTPSLSAN